MNRISLKYILLEKQKDFACGIKIPAVVGMPKRMFFNIFVTSS
jgi:hypothetical protein